MTVCNIPTCPTPWAPHDMHLMSEPSGVYAMRVAPDRKSVTLWLQDGTMLKRYQPDAIRQLRYDVREHEARLDVMRALEAHEDAIDVAAKAALR